MVPVDVPHPLLLRFALEFGHGGEDLGHQLRDVLPSQDVPTTEGAALR